MLTILVCEPFQHNYSHECKFSNNTLNAMTEKTFHVSTSMGVRVPER